MNKIIVLGIIGLFLISFVSGYICIDKEDNKAVQEFKTRLNYQALLDDIEDNDLTEEGLRIKLKYFGPCR